MDRYQLGTFRLKRNQVSGDLLLLVSGPTIYKPLLNRAFGNLYFSRTFEDRNGQFDWGTYIKGAEAAEEAALSEFCGLLQTAVFIDDDLDESFALGMHTQTSAAGGYERTELGQLVYGAKSYGPHHPGDKQRAVELATRLAQFILQHPTYRRADFLATVPPSNLNKAYDLPSLLAEVIAGQVGIAMVRNAVSKARDTRPMKDCRTVQEKIDNLKDAFVGDSTLVKDKTVILVDDIYETGFSIDEVGRALHGAGASLVLGLVATKTARDLVQA
jgi:hypothetical protein